MGRAKSRKSADSHRLARSESAKGVANRGDRAIHVTADLANQTLSAALRHWLADHSWSQLRRLIESRHVTINGNACTDAGRRLNTGDVVKVLVQPAAAPPQEHHVKVHYLDQHLIVVEKPAGITSNRHREERHWPKRRKQIQPTLDEMLPHVIAKIEGRRAKGVPPPVRAVHRLDRETSGLMVFARTHAAERILAQQFRQHTTHRRYLAIVEGRVAAQTIRTRLIRDRGDGRRGSTEKPGVGKEAITHLKPMETIAGYTLIQCKLETGRTHQIRIHLSEQGHPVCGEKVYRTSGIPAASKPKVPGVEAKRSPQQAPRLALHAAELGFVHPVSGKPLRFQSPQPNELANFWRHLKQLH
jgi:23S rRNA pseudouridine1911/1915/1917 synthase